MSSDLANATIKLPDGPCTRVVWSPCSRFIAISAGGVQILDAVTLKQLRSLILPCPPQGGAFQLLSFSPESQMLTCYSRLVNLYAFITWDLQTGIQASKIPMGKSSTRELKSPCSITYSECGMMLGVLFKNYNQHHQVAGAICSYDILSSTLTYCYPIEGSINSRIWTQGGCVQFAALETYSITIWGVGFTSKCPPTKVKSLSTPGSFDPWECSLLPPTPLQLAFQLDNSLLVWDVHQSKLLLDHLELNMHSSMPFSYSGHFFAHMVYSGQLYLWKKFSMGYTLYQKHVPSVQISQELGPPPNRQSNITFGGVYLTPVENNSYHYLIIGSQQRNVRYGVGSFLDLCILNYQRLSF